MSLEHPAGTSAIMDSCGLCRKFSSSLYKTILKDPFLTIIENSRTLQTYQDSRQMLSLNDSCFRVDFYDKKRSDIRVFKNCLTFKSVVLIKSYKD